MPKDYTELEPLKRRFNERNANIKRWRDLYNLVNKYEKSAYASGITNKPRTDCNLGIHILSANNVQPRIVAAGEEPVVRRGFSKAELACVSILNQKDAEYADTGREWWLRHAATLAILTGSFYVLSGVVNDHGAPWFMAENWETEDCYPGWGEHSLRRFLHEYEVDIDVAEEKAETNGWEWEKTNLPKNAETVKISDYYFFDEGKVWHQVWMAEEDVMKTDHPEWDEIPVRGGPVNGGFSLLAPNEATFDAYNKFYSDFLESCRRALNAVFVQKTRTGQPLITSEMLARGEMVNVATADMEFAGEYYKLFDALPEFSAASAVFRGDMQRGGFSDAFTGAISGQPWAGYAINMLMTGSLVQIGPAHNGLQRTAGRIFQDWLTQFQNGPFKPIKIRGNATGKLDGYFHEDFARKDVPEHNFFEARIKLGLPDNKAEMAAIARQLAPQLPQIQSLYTILDEYMGVQAPEFEIERIQEDMARLSPLHQQVSLAIQYRLQADDLAKQGNLPAAKLLYQASQMLLTQGQRPEQQGVSQAELPAQAGGVSNPRESMVRSMLNAPQDNGARVAGNQGIDLGRKR